MLKYLIIQLCDSAPSFCHYPNNNKDRKLISIDDLKEGLFFSLKENLNVQIIYPDYELPGEYLSVIDDVDHINIVPFSNADRSFVDKEDIIILDSWEYVNKNLKKENIYVLRTSKDDLFRNYMKLIDVLPHVQRLNVVLTDIPDFNESDFDTYREILDKISDTIEKEYISGLTPQTNILTDRLVIKKMNNCNAGDEVVTLAPDGNFYICPAFYFQGHKSVGNIKDGLKIRNPQLFKLSHAPICRKCDAYQCKRCVWLNEKQTLEINIPGREQCVVSHLERNESRNLLNKIRKHGTFMPEIEINEIDYIDPFEIVIQRK